MKKTKLNGSLDTLAKAMRQVFTEAVQEGIEPIRKDVAGVKKDVAGIKKDVAGVKRDIKALDKKIDDGLEATNKNVQAKLSQNRKDISADVKKAIKGR